MDEEQIEKLKDQCCIYAKKAEEAKERGDKATYIFNLKLALNCMAQIEGQSINDMIEDHEIKKTL